MDATNDKLRYPLFYCRMMVFVDLMMKLGYRGEDICPIKLYQCISSWRARSRVVPT